MLVQWVDGVGERVTSGTSAGGRRFLIGDAMTGGSERGGHSCRCTSRSRPGEIAGIVGPPRRGKSTG